MSSCRSWSLINLQSLIRLEILEIMDLEDLGSDFLFHRGILEILDLDYLLLQWEPGDPGSLIFALS